MVGPNYARPRDAGARRSSDSSRAAQAESLADAPWWQVFDDPALQGLIKEAIANNLDLRIGGCAGRGSARPRRHRQVVSLSAGRRRRQLRRAADVELRTTQDEDDDGTDQTAVVRLSAVVGARSVRPPPPRGGSGARPGARHRAGPARRARHAGRRRGDQLLPAARARPAARDRAPDAAPQRRDRAYFQNRLDGGVSNRLELDRIRANRAQTAAAIPDSSSSRWRWSRTRSRCCSDVSRGRSRARLSRPAKPCRRPSRRAAGVAPRAAARRGAGRTAPRGGECRHRRRQGAVLSRASA